MCTGPVAFQHRKPPLNHHFKRIEFCVNCVPVILSNLYVLDKGIEPVTMYMCSLSESLDESQAPAHFFSIWNVAYKVCLIVPSIYIYIRYVCYSLLLYFYLDFLFIVLGWLIGLPLGKTFNYWFWVNLISENLHVILKILRYFCRIFIWKVMSSAMYMSSSLHNLLHRKNKTKEKVQKSTLHCLFIGIANIETGLHFKKAKTVVYTSNRYLILLKACISYFWYVIYSIKLSLCHCNYSSSSFHFKINLINYLFFGLRFSIS